MADALDDRGFVLDELHKAYHHYIKVVGTMYEVPAAWGKSELVTYQMLAEVRGCALSDDDPWIDNRSDRTTNLNKPNPTPSPTPQSSVMTYAADEVPEARFSYEVSPMSVIVKKTGRRRVPCHVSPHVCPTFRIDRQTD